MVCERNTYNNKKTQQTENKFPLIRKFLHTMNPATLPLPTQCCCKNITDSKLSLQLNQTQYTDISQIGPNVESAKLDPGVIQ